MKIHMINVTESAVNLCLNHLVFADDSTALYKYYKDATAIISTSGFPEPERVYIGAEFCDKILYHIRNTNFFDHLLSISQYAEHVSFVVPPVRESSTKYLKEILTIIEKYPFIDELIFNDFGTMRYLHQRYPQYDLVAGRLIDKGMREMRFDVCASSEIVKDNSRLMEHTNLDSLFYDQLFSKYNVCRIELDTLNGRQLQLNTFGRMKYTVHYPRIFLSRSDYCEFSGIGKKLSEKFKVQGRCTHMCAEVYEKLCAPSENEIYKCGNAVFSTQKEKLSDSVNGLFRFVYSQGV